ncbi:hypothetical protein [Streptomyces sp. NPDC101150]|uniref:hypothetical protein n=1 Tax=Streptomyces sp. NPDC101150 TaxID=3366114 RepID=UPI00382E91D0
MAFEKRPWIVTNIENARPGAVWVLRPLYGGGLTDRDRCRVPRPEIGNVQIMHRRGEWVKP